MVAVNVQGTTRATTEIFHEMIREDFARNAQVQRFLLETTCLTESFLADANAHVRMRNRASTKIETFASMRPRAHLPGDSFPIV